MRAFLLNNPASIVEQGLKSNAELTHGGIARGIIAQDQILEGIGVAWCEGTVVGAEEQWSVQHRMPRLREPWKPDNI